jgi:hypothetical protein
MKLFYLDRPVEVADNQNADSPCFVPGIAWDGKRYWFWSSQLMVLPWFDISFTEVANA